MQTETQNADLSTKLSVWVSWCNEDTSYNISFWHIMQVYSAIIIKANYKFGHNKNEIIHEKNVETWK